MEVASRPGVRPSAGEFTLLIFPDENQSVVSWESKQLQVDGVGCD